MSTNPSVSAASPGPLVLGPRAAEPAGPWESQHLCGGSARGAGGAGGGGRPPGPPRAWHPPPNPRSFTERSEWNEWVPASSDARGNQMISREGPIPPRKVPGEHPAGQGRPPLPSLLACATHNQKPDLRGRHPFGGGGGLEGSGGTCGSSGLEYETRAEYETCEFGLPSRFCEERVTGRSGEAASIRHLPGPTLCPELSARGAKTQSRIKGKSVSSVSPKRSPDISPK